MSDAVQTPFADLVKDALDRMEAGARIITDNIPGDTSLSSYSHGPDVGKAIAARIRLLEQQLSTAREEALEEAAKWHDEQSIGTFEKMKLHNPGKIHDLLNDRYQHHLYAAAAIRSLGEKE